MLIKQTIQITIKREKQKILKISGWEEVWVETKGEKWEHCRLQCHRACSGPRWSLSGIHMSELALGSNTAIIQFSVTKDWKDDWKLSIQEGCIDVTRTLNLIFKEPANSSLLQASEIESFLFSLNHKTQ